LAIFSLEGLGQVRIAHMDNFPARAKWSGSSDHPTQVQTYGRGAAQPVPKTVVDRSGLIWQAEELLQNGVWTRYYGFVGQHTLQKIPSDQIVFLKPNERYLPESATPQGPNPDASHLQLSLPNIASMKPPAANAVIADPKVP